MTRETPKLRPTTYCPPGGRRSSVRMQGPAAPERTIATRLARLAAQTRWFTRRAVEAVSDTRLPRSA